MRFQYLYEVCNNQYGPKALIHKHTYSNLLIKKTIKKREKSEGAVVPLLPTSLFFLKKQPNSLQSQADIWQNGRNK